MTARAALAGIALALSLLRAAPARADVDVVGCEPATHRLVALEVALAGAPDALAVTVRCRGDRADVRVGRAARAVALATVAPNARARLLALVAAELIGPSPSASASASVEPLRRRARTKRADLTEDGMFARILAGGLTAALFASPVAAAPRAPKPEAPVAVEPTALTRPPPPPKAEHAAPALRVEDVYTAVGERVREVTDEQIRLLVTLRKSAGPADPEAPDLQARLADLYADQQRYYKFRARTLDAKIFDARRAGRAPDVARLGAQQADEEKRARDFLTRAVAAYIELVNGPAPYAKMDEALFAVAQLSTEAGRADAARAFYKRILKDHPTSRYVPDALLAFGEYYFDAGDLEHAVQSYDLVLQHPDSPIAIYALYKKGWCDFNLGDFKGALATFLSVIAESRKGSARARLQLEREARKDAVRAYAHVGTPERAWPFFQRVGGDAAAPGMLEQLALLYHEQGKFDSATRLYRQLMALFPQSPRVCGWQSEVVRATLAMGGSRAEPDAARELGRLAALAARERDGSECRDTTARELRELAMVWHKEAQKTNQLPTYELAGQLYREYLSAFPKAPDIAMLSFYYAEVLYRLERHCEAAPLYTAIVKGGGPHRDDAAYAAVLSYKSCLKLDDHPPAPAPAPAPHAHAAGPRPIPESWQKMLDSFDLYLQYVKNGPDALRIKYRKALTLYEFDHCKEAAPLFADIARHHQDSELAPYSADLLFDCYAQAGDKPALRAATTELCVPALGAERPDFARRCGEIRAALLRDQAEEREAARDFKAAADFYMQLAREFPEYAKLDEIYYNIAIDYQRSKLIGLAILSFQELIRTRPDSPLAKKATYMIGRAYQDIAAFDAAADNYERFAARWPGERDAQPALRRATFIRGGLGQTQKALDDTGLFLKNYGARTELTDSAAGVAFAAAQIFEQQRDSARLGEQLESYLRTWGARGGVDREIIAHVKLGELAWRAACPIDGANGGCVEVTRPRRAAAAATARTGAKPRAKRRPGTETCSDEVRITVHARRRELADKAQSHFAAALKLYQNGAALRRVPGKDDAERETRAADAAYYAAQARLAQADAELERFLAEKLPPGLVFAPGASGALKARDAESRKRLGAWLARKTQELEHTSRTYQSVILMKQTHFAIAAAARIGQLYQDFSAQLAGAPIPIAPPAPPGTDAREWATTFRDAYCDALGTRVGVLEDKAEDALKLCLDKSTQLSWFNEWSATCEEELNQLKPASYPLASELRAQPGFTTAAVERTRVQSLP
jgi:TolA-binding protein